MNNKEFQVLMDRIKKTINTGKTKLEQNIPWIESNLKIYADKFGIKPEDIDQAKEKVRKKLDQIQKKT